MTPLAKGQNGPITAPVIQVSVQVSATSDLSALLVTDSGKVRSDQDFIFYNQPNGPGVSLVNGALQVTFAQIPADIAQVRAVITLDNGTFAGVQPPTARVDANGQELYSYRIDGLSSESVVIAIEVYRRQGAWKVRAVGQGYAGGFASLVTDHGVTVDDAPASTPTPPAAPSYTPPPPPPTPPSYNQPPAAPTYNQPAATPSYSPPPSAPSYNQPPAAPSYTPSASTPPTPPSTGGEISLTKSRPVSLTKGQRVSLQKDGGVALSRIMMGLGWDPIERRGMFSRSAEIDLDASVLLYGGGQLVDVVYYAQLTSKDGSLRHHGDNLTGAGDGDDEVIDIDLTRVPPHVDTLLLIVTSYQGQTFEQVQNAFCRLIDTTDRNAELARYTLAGGMPFTGLVMAKLYREGGGWKLQAIGDGISARHPGEAAPQLPRFL